jgi:hypothetical protein
MSRRDDYDHLGLALITGAIVLVAAVAAWEHYVSGWISAGWNGSPQTSHMLSNLSRDRGGAHCACLFDRHLEAVEVAVDNEMRPLRIVLLRFLPDFLRRLTQAGPEVLIPVLVP